VRQQGAAAVWRTALAPDYARSISVPLPIETERLLIRAFAPDSDSAAMAEVYCDPEVMRFIPGGALADVGAVRSTLEKHVEAQQTRGFSSWALVERETMRVVGDVGFGVFEPTGDIELGYTLARDAWGRGYATEAAGACLAAGLEHLGVPRIIAVVDVDNETSQRVAERIGMTRVETIEAHGRPHVLFTADLASPRPKPAPSDRG
jgi:ribosomal-protein-alanine N-acetyltransferase